MVIQLLYMSVFLRVFKVVIVIFSYNFSKSKQKQKIEREKSKKKRNNLSAVMCMFFLSVTLIVSFDLCLTQLYGMWSSVIEYIYIYIYDDRHIHTMRMHLNNFSAKALHIGIMNCVYDGRLWTTKYR